MHIFYSDCDGNAPESAIPTRDLYQFVFRNIEPVETSCEKRGLKYKFKLSFKQMVYY